MTEHFNDRPDHQDKHFGDEQDFAVDGEHARVDDESTPFTNDSGPVGETVVDDALDEAEATAEGRHDALDGPEEQPRPTGEQLGQNLRKAAEDTAYAAVGFVGLVSEKAKAFYEDQKKQYADAHPDADAEHGAKNFLAQLKEQLDKLIEDVNRGFRDLAERGRAAGGNVADDAAAKAERFADDVADAADKAADDVADTAQRAADHVEDFAEGVQRHGDEL